MCFFINIPKTRSNNYDYVNVVMSVNDILRYLQKLKCSLNTLVISVGYKVTGTLKTTVAYCPYIGEW